MTGAPGSGKSALVARLIRERADWLGLVNAVAPDAGANLKLLSGGCPCCTGRVALQISLARGLRASKAIRAFVELSDPRHATALAQSLGELPLSLSIAEARTIVLPGDALLAASDLES